MSTMSILEIQLPYGARLWSSCGGLQHTVETEEPFGTKSAEQTDEQMEDRQRYTRFKRVRYASMQGGLRRAYAEVPAFGWHQGPTDLKKAFRAYPQNFVTEPQTHRQTLRLSYIDMRQC